MLRQIAPGRMAGFDSLRARSPDAYWQEIGQLVVRRAMVENVSRRDSVRGRALAVLWGAEAEARSLRRAYREAAESERRRQRRAELVLWAVDDIIRDAQRL